MRKFPRCRCCGLSPVLALRSRPRVGAAAETRFALVIGNDEYKAGKLATPANDAGLVADALQAAGFTVTGARNLDQATLRESFREFLGQVAAAGPDAVALVYLCRLSACNSPATIISSRSTPTSQRDVDVPLQAIRISDFTATAGRAARPGQDRHSRCGAAKPVRARRPAAGERAGAGRSGAGMAIAFNAAPGTVGPRGAGSLWRLCDRAHGNDRAPAGLASTICSRACACASAN